mmetsp:Transcript_18374/g.31425  ORF Transcript_18374/g.31425 Transcript_18374/m.31425 type:complete len:136 (+) Transcript_18374:179-586(+)
MGSNSSTAAHQSGAAPDRYLEHVESQAIRAIVPKGLQDEKAKELKYQLHWCLTRNDWWFTGGGIVLGGALSMMSGSIKPFAATVLLAPAADWAYGRHVCAEQLEAYSEYKEHIVLEYRRQVEEARAHIRNVSSEQ